eukprot:gene8698-2097_t
MLPAIVVVLFLGSRGSKADLGYIRTSATQGNRQFYDEAGRARLFHGGNRVPKASPWYFDDMLQSDGEAGQMEELGFNVVRLGFMWSGYNPAPGVFNASYITVIKSIVAKLNAHGVYALLDLHQDIMSSKFCLYDGVPLWVVDKSTAKHAFPWPLKGNCSRDWEDNAFAEASEQAYQDLYDNHEGMLDDLASFWAHAASVFKDTPGILGYEIMNEPFPGNLYADPTLALPGEAGRRNLQRMNDRIAAAITANDDKHVIFYEPVTWGMIFDGNVSGSGFEHVPGGHANAGRAAFSFHYYCGTRSSHEFVPRWRKTICDATMAPLVFAAVEHDLERLGGSAMMTEGMACGGANRSDYDECVDVMDGLDTHLFSWTDYGDSQGATWAPSSLQQLVWARSYARAVAGTPIKAPTEVFASTKHHYQNGVRVKTTPNVVAAQHPGSDDVWLLTGDPIHAVAAVAADGGSDSVACVWLDAK